MKRRGKISKAIHRIYIALIMLFLYSPIAVLILFSFNAGESRGKFAGFSLRWYKDLVNRDALLGSFRNTYRYLCCNCHPQDARHYEKLYDKGCQHPNA
jgi:ABC-type spermidine/putrescine transport system permease subunit II